MQEPLISIAMPVFNGGECLNLAVNSIVNQTYKNWELIIIDDGSTDGCCNNLTCANDERIRLLQDGCNKGLAPRLNQAIDLAKGQYFARMDQDDLAYPSRLQVQCSFLQNNRHVDLVSSRAMAFVQNKVIGYLPFRQTHQQICSTPWNGFYMPHPTWMGRMEWFRRYRYLTPEVKLAEDQELLLRSYPNSVFASIPETLLAYQLRSRVVFKSTFKARTNLLRIQCNIFIRRQQVKNLLLALSFYMIKTAIDLIKLMGWRKHSVFRNKISDKELKAWRDLSVSTGLKSE